MQWFWLTNSNLFTQRLDLGVKMNREIKLWAVLLSADLIGCTHAQV